MSQRLRTWLSRFGGRTQSETPSCRQESEDEGTTVLYSCNSCDTTYISENMNSCPKCDETVIQVPSERELGISTK